MRISDWSSDVCSSDLPGDILTKTDRMSMAVSLEAREPLLDYRLIEFAASLPASMRVKRGTGKAIMKQAMERYLPHDILYRSEEHTSELQSLMRISYAVFCLKKKNIRKNITQVTQPNSTLHK